MSRNHGQILKAFDKTAVLLITDFRGLIPQRIMAWDGLDLGAIRETLEHAGIEVQIIGAHEIDMVALKARKHVAAIYASSQEPRYKQYLQDIMANLHFSGVILFPSLAHMMAHEDKAFQAIKLATTNIRAPRSFAFGSKQQACDFLDQASFPLVGKTVDGFGSKGVCLLRNRQEGRRFVDRHMFHRALKKGRPLYVRALQRVFKPRPVLGILVFQEFVPTLLGDWKILIWGDTACGLYRENRRNDFRASGSGRIRFVDIPVQVLDFAYEALGQLDLPWGSLDIACDGHQCYLLEYQGIHFGLTTAEKGIFYYVRDSTGAWEKRMGRIEIEREMARIVIRYLADKGWLNACAQNVGG